MGLFGTNAEKEIKQRKKNKALHEKGETLYLKAQELEKKGKLKKAKKAYQEAALSSPRVALEYVERLRNEEAWEEYYKLCYDCHYLVRQRDDKDYFPFYKLTAECCYKGLGTELDRPGAYDILNSASLYSGEEDDLETVLFQLKCASEIVRDFRDKSYPDIAFLRRNDIVAVTNEHKWKNIAKKLEQKAASLGNRASIEKVAGSDDRDAAYKYTVELACSGDYDAAASLFWKFLPMSKLPKGFDSITMLTLLEEGAKNGHADCMLALALLYLRSYVDSCIRVDRQADTWQNPLPHNEEKFVYWLKKANEANVQRVLAKVLLAEYYATGKIWLFDHFDQNPLYEMQTKDIQPQKAYAILDRAIPNQSQRYAPGHEAGRKMLAAMLFFGYGTDTNVAEAQDLMNTFGADDSMWLIDKDKQIFEALQAEFDQWRYLMTLPE